MYFQSFSTLFKRHNVSNYLNLNNQNETDFEVPEYDFKSEKIFTDEIDYYHSNVIARASKTMSECKNTRMSLPKTGTDNL